MLGGLGISNARADGDLGKVNHIIIMMQENHSFDNYFGVLAYAPGTPYKSGPCAPATIAVWTGSPASAIR
jgi:phospholipase C